MSALALGSCGGGGGGGGATLSADAYRFDPLYRGGSQPRGSLGVPLPPAGLSASASGGTVTLTWVIPKAYKSTKLSIGYRVFRKLAPEKTSSSVWDFSSDSTPDWASDLGVSVAAADTAACTMDGRCSLVDKVGGPVEVAYAVMAYWNIGDLHSGRSGHVSASVTTAQGAVNYSYPVGFMNVRPLYLIGSVVAPSSRAADLTVFSYTPAAAPWYFLPAVATQKTREKWTNLAATLVVGMSGDGLTMLLPDSEFSRTVYLSRGSLAECSQYSPAFEPICRSVMLSRPFIPVYAQGQPSYTLSLPYAEGRLPASRKFSSRQTAILTAASGTRYIFVADEQRILVRAADIGSCAYDPGEGGDAERGLGPEGTCGFQWSIGTYSPRQSCGLRSGGSPAIGEDDCSGADSLFSISDSTPPSDHTLRRPGAPVIVGAHLYIPDAGNSRVVRLANFETALKTCGRLLAAGSAEPNDFCRFDLILGQTGASPSDPAKFSYRSCVRGGEEGGMDGFTPLAQNAAFIDPTGQGSSGGAACRLDMVTELLGGADASRRSRQAADFKDTPSSMISPDTGLLSEVTKSSFRSPVEIKYDPASGFLYVLDAGFTVAESASSTNAAVLPPRIMVWRRDPFSFQACLPTGAPGEPPSCYIDENNRCRGGGCVDRQCERAECDASYFLGQSSPLYGFTYKRGQTFGVDVVPDGYYPLSAFDLGESGGQAGVWAVGGRDARVFHWAEVSQTAVPSVHNAKSGDGIDPTYRNLVFSGINVDKWTGEIITWDATLNIGVAWGGAVAAE